MCRELGWNDTLHCAKQADPSDPGVRNRYSSQWIVLVRRGLPHFQSQPPFDDPRIVASLDRKTPRGRLLGRSRMLCGCWRNIAIALIDEAAGHFERYRLGYNNYLGPLLEKLESHRYIDDSCDWLPIEFCRLKSPFFHRLNCSLGKRGTCSCVDNGFAHYSVVVYHDVQ